VQRGRRGGCKAGIHHQGHEAHKGGEEQALVRDGLAQGGRGGRRQAAVAKGYGGQGSCPPWGQNPGEAGKAAANP